MMNQRLFALTLIVVLSARLSSVAATAPGAAGDGKTSIYYDPATGVFGIQADGLSVGLFDVLSESGIFTSSASLPPNPLFLENHEYRKSFAAFQEHAFHSDFLLGGVAPPGLDYVFLLNDLTLTGSGGLGTDNRILDLVYLGETPPLIPPAVHEMDLGDQLPVEWIDHTFTSAAAQTTITWANLAVSGPGTPLHAPTLSPDGTFQWNPAGSSPGLYNFDVTATNAGGSDMGRLSINLIAPQAAPPIVIDPQPPLPDPAVPIDEPPPNHEHIDPGKIGVFDPRFNPFGPIEPIILLPSEDIDRPFVWLTPELKQVIDDAGLSVDINYAPWHDGLVYVLVGSPVAGSIAIDNSHTLAADGTYLSFALCTDYFARSNGTSASEAFLDSASLVMFGQPFAAGELSPGIPEPATLALALAMFTAASSVRATKRRRTNGSRQPIAESLPVKPCRL